MFRQTFKKLATLAGRRFRISHSGSADISITFDPNGRESQPCALLILGVEGGGIVYVGAHKDLRVCSVPVFDPSSGETNNGEHITRLFEDDEVEFAKAVANTAIHEAGHLLGLQHVNSIHNYMHSKEGRIGGNLPKAVRTLSTMRAHMAGQKRFTVDQTDIVVKAIRNALYSGGMEITEGKEYKKVK